MPQRPFSQACENNKQPILEVLAHYLSSPVTLLEIGSGTGQHGVFFAEHLPHVTWQTSDLRDNHAAIHAWIEHYAGDNLLPPFELNVANFPTDLAPVQAVFTANTAHIMSWDQARQMIRGVGLLLPKDGVWIIYGPFNYGGQFTSESNANFNDWLKAQAPHRAIRDFEAVCDEAKAAGMSLIEDRPMPANNRCLVFHKKA
ncbi:MAG: DUF938 domain-containing protein [Cellvibrionaceae bacterium]